MCDCRLSVVVKSRPGNTGTHMDILISCCRVAPEFSPLVPSHAQFVCEQEDGEARTFRHRSCNANVVVKSGILKTTVLVGWCIQTHLHSPF